MQAGIYQVEFYAQNVNPSCGYIQVLKDNVVQDTWISSSGTNTCLSTGFFAASRIMGFGSNQTLIFSAVGAGSGIFFQNG
jgi:hypothetical protein